MTIVSRLRAAGAENIVVVDLPDIGLTPRAAGAAGVATFLSAAFNSSLNNALNSLSFPVVRVSLFNLIRDFVTQPAKYGFTNVTGMGLANVANSDTYLFWDDIHPTTRAHRFVAEEMYAEVLAAGLIKHPLNNKSVDGGRAAPKERQEKAQGEALGFLHFLNAPP